MTLDATVPNSSTLRSSMDDYQRETRAEVNSLVATIAGEITGVETITSVSSETLAAGTQMLQFKLINVSATVSYLSGGNEGQIVLLKVASGKSVTFAHSGAQTNGDIYLNGAGSDLNATEYDLLVLINRNGDTDTGVLGYWEELFRTLWV